MERREREQLDRHIEGDSDTSRRGRAPARRVPEGDELEAAYDAHEGALHEGATDEGATDEGVAMACMRAVAAAAQASPRVKGESAYTAVHMPNREFGDLWMVFDVTHAPKRVHTLAAFDTTDLAMGFVGALLDHNSEMIDLYLRRARMTFRPA